MRQSTVLCIVALTVVASVQLASAACPALTINFFPDGTKNVPTGWTKDAQVAAGNEDSSSLNTIKLTATPPPKLFVQPVHPLFSRKACVPTDCLPAGKGRRLQQLKPWSISASTQDSMDMDVDQAADQEADEEADRELHLESGQELHQEGSQEAEQAADRVERVAELQRAEQGGVNSRLNPLFWNLPYNPFGRRDTKPSSGAAPAAAPSSSGGSSNAPAAPSSSDSEHQEAGRGALEPAKQRLTDASGSGSSVLKDSIAAGGAESGLPKTGWTEWKEDEGWWGGDDRQLQACTTTVAQPASYDIWWNIDGGVAKKATMPKEGAPFILLSNLDTLAPGKHTLNIKATMMKGTAEVNGVPSLQPPADQVYTSKVVFNLVEGKGDAAEAVEPSTTKPAAGKAPADKPAAAAEAPAAAEGAEKPAEKPAAEAPAEEEAKAEKPPEKKKGPEINVAPTVDAKVAQQAVKYYCMRQYNVGGKIHSQKNVTAGDEGVNQCAVACNALSQECSGFGVSGDKCFLMKAFNTSSSAADATLDALCMKSANDWLDFGIQTSANKVGGGFFCVRGYDIKGDPAGTGDMENPVQTANTELAGMTPSTCAIQCRATAGCQYFIMKKPTVAGGTSTCYLKMKALGGLYGTTGPSKEIIDFTCFNGQEQWLTFGGQLDYAVPSPEVNTGVQTPALAAVTSPGGAAVGAAGAKTYRCIKGYQVNGTSMGDVQLSMGDEGLSQCAGKCDGAANCVAYSMTETGLCTMLQAISFNVSGPSPKTYGMCFGSPADWNKFGNPDSSGMYCVKNYDFAGDGVRTVDYITITTGAGAVQFCKLQCAAEPQCQFSVTSLGKCFMKQNILSGSFGTTKPDTAVDASCVKGESNWALAALQVSAAPAGQPSTRRPGNGTRGLTTGKKASLKGASSSSSARYSFVVALLGLAVAALFGM